MNFHSKNKLTVVCILPSLQRIVSRTRLLLCFCFTQKVCLLIKSNIYGIQVSLTFFPRSRRTRSLHSRFALLKQMTCAGVDVHMLSYHPLLLDYLSTSPGQFTAVQAPAPDDPGFDLATATLVLYGANPDTAHAALNTLSQPAKASPCDWWSACMTSGTDADVMCTLPQLALRRGPVGDACAQLLLSAARRTVWPELYLDAAMTMLTDVTCITPALAFLSQVAVHPGTPLPALWADALPIAAVRDTIGAIPNVEHRTWLLADTEERLRRFNVGTHSSPVMLLSKSNESLPRTLTLHTPLYVLQINNFSGGFTGTSANTQLVLLAHTVTTPPDH